MNMPGIDEIEGLWKQQVGAAKIAWGKLTEDELLRIEGHEQKLAGLVQERYAITRDEASRQVKAFFEKLRKTLADKDSIRAKWKQQVGAARITWDKLTEDELLKIEGHEQKLAGLLQERYAITRYEADQQVKSFFARQRRPVSGADEIREKWRLQIANARQVWRKLSEDELLQSDGHLQKLAVLVQERYAISRYAAEKQVQSFIDSSKH